MCESLNLDHRVYGLYSPHYCSVAFAKVPGLPDPRIGMQVVTLLPPAAGLPPISVMVSSYI